MNNATDKMAKARLVKKAMREENGKDIRLNPLEKSKANPQSYKLAIAAKCYDCSHGQRQEVTHCTVLLCPLHSFRPWQDK